MRKIPKVSIIIPAKNEADNIGICLDSILAIDYSADEYEIIVVDNGSDDETACIASDKGARVYTLPYVNISTLRNFGTQQARGDIVVFLDADCTVVCDWLKNAEKYFEDTSVVCFGSAPIIPANPTWVQTSWFWVRKKNTMVTEINWLESMNMFVFKKIYERVGGFNESLITCEDVDLSYRLSEHGKIISDQNIQAVHHGEAKDIIEFFKKERWRGKSNYVGLRQHGLRLAEIPSLLLPIYYLVMASFLFVSALTMQWYFIVIVAVIWQLPIAVITFVKLRLHEAFRYYCKVYVLYNIYYLARGLAVLR
jgi:glycosyltransferase involved in cell wall biosynthesis